MRLRWVPGPPPPTHARAQAGGYNSEKQGLGAGAGEGGKDEGPLDPFEAYRQRMQLGYKHRPNPLGNPRKSYY